MVTAKMKHEFPDGMRISDGMAGRSRRGKAGQAARLLTAKRHFD
jgi:hypothetical protein